MEGSGKGNGCVCGYTPSSDTFFLVNVNRARVRKRKQIRQHKSERRAADPRPHIAKV
jgi:hypothetical protein